MSRIVTSSDLHLEHNNICNYRQQFKTPEEHDDYIIKRHKETIKKNDTWYCFGDVAFTRKGLMRLKEIICRRKVLILGNHELEGTDLTMKDLLEVFDQVYSLKKHKSFGVKYWFSHCPIHPSEMRFMDLNIHGHTHDKVLDDPRYINVCVEHTDFGVVPLEDIAKKYLKDVEKGVYQEMDLEKEYSRIETYVIYITKKIVKLLYSCYKDLIKFIKRS